jgi:hypothetical protein
MSHPLKRPQLTYLGAWGTFPYNLDEILLGWIFGLDAPKNRDSSRRQAQKNLIEITFPKDALADLA